MKIRIDQISVGERRRQDVGDIAQLARSIERFGLLHPIILDADGTLVAGGRRLLASASLGWMEIEARSLGELSQAERREIELEENLRRKDLTEYERSRDLAQLAETAAAILKDEAEYFPDSGKKSRGQPRKADGLVPVADRIGVPKSTIAEAREHVETAAAYPFMQTWKQYQVLEAREALEAIPADDRDRAMALIAQPAIPAKNAIGIVKNLGVKTPDERRRIFALAESADSRDRSAALTEAAAMPAMPDPRLTLLDDARRVLRKAARLFPDDPANGAISDVLDCLKTAYQAVKAARDGH